MVAVLMLASLLASVGAALWIVHTRQAMGDLAGDLLNEIRQKGLAHYWPQRREVSWYLAVDATGKPVGVRAVLRRPVLIEGDKTPRSFYGSDFLLTPNGSLQEAWNLRDDLSAGQYEGPSSRGITRILLKGRQVEVQQPDPDRRRAASGESECPENYVPEGAMDLLLRLVVQRGQPVTYKMIDNDSALDDGQVHFTTVRATPEGDGAVRFEFTAGARRVRKVLHVEKDGQVSKIEDVTNKVTYRLATFQEVQRVIPAGLLEEIPDEFTGRRSTSRMLRDIPGAVMRMIPAPDLWLRDRGR
jgi:hypothetical protein